MFQEEGTLCAELERREIAQYIQGALGRQVDGSSVLTVTYSVFEIRGCEMKQDKRDIAFVPLAFSIN